MERVMFTLALNGRLDALIEYVEIYTDGLNAEEAEYLIAEEFEMWMARKATYGWERVVRTR